MPRHRYYEDDESEEDSEYSETDVSYSRPGGGRTVVKRRSFSRARRRSPQSNTYLTPAVIAAPPRRSASTGGRRRRGDDPIVVVDVHNDVHAKQESRDRRNTYNRMEQQDDIEEVDIIRSHRRPRAVAEVPVSRTPSPRQQQRDWELLMDQRILAKNDIRQDLELAKQQQEIERLERQLAKSREKRREEPPQSSVSRHRIVEEDHWEDELAERLRKLDRLERAKRTEEEQKMADYRAKVRRLEEMERKAAEEEEAKRLADERHLRELEKREKTKAEKDRIKKEIKDEEARRALEEEERRRELEDLKRKAVEEWRLEQEAKKLKAIEEKERKDREFRERLRLEFGYSEEEIEKILKKKNDEHEKKEEHKEQHHHHHQEGGGNAIVVIDPPPPPAREKTTFIRVHRKYLLPATLEAYKLQWDWDDRDGNYIIIKQWISEDFQEELFEHTRRLRSGKLIEETSTTLTELKVNDRKRDKMYLVRKKNPSGKAWIFT